ncbi:hypothetical protein PENSPDRAFT_681271 [Peniophora sp. CONT]|nr:hypothetical protein PENSPDRAFT_681271 [Peniophora sp. CONT]
MNHPLSETVALIVFNGSEDSVGPFEALRSEFEMKGSLTVPDGHFWGRGVERPNRFFWIVFFKSDASLSEYFEDGSRPAFRDRILEMTSDPIIFHGLHTRPNMRELLKAPVVEVSHFRLKPSGTVAESAVQCQIVSDALIARKTKGLHGFSWALTEERGGEGVYIGGWDSITDREASINYEDHDLIEQIEKGFDLAESIAMMNVVFQLHTR